MNHQALESEISRKVHALDFSLQKEIMQYVNKVSTASAYNETSYRKRAISEIKNALKNI